MSEHSILPPSSAARRVACPGSRALEAKYPEDQDSPHAREGHLAHLAASLCLERRLQGKPTEWASESEVTQEMIEGAELYTSCVFETSIEAELYADFRDGAPKETPYTYHIEQRVDISTIHPECWGTPDCWMITEDRRDLYIWDYKFGHKFVEVFENWQLIEYAAGIMEKVGINGLEDQRITVHFHIIQPRSFHRDGPVRSWRVRGHELRSYFNVLRSSEATAMEENAPCFPSSECTYCTGRHACEALQRAAMDASDMSALNVPLELSPAATGQELKMLKHAAELLDARITGLEEQAKAMIIRGQRVPHFKLEQGYGRDIWTKEVEEIITLGGMFGVNLVKPIEAITPKQAIKAGVPENVVQAYMERPKGAMRLVADDGKEARKIFGG